MLNNQVIENAYDWIAGDSESHACDGIPDDACEHVPRNFFLNAVNGTLTKLADQLVAPGLVLTWFLDVLGAPASVIGFLTPVRQASALLPQLVISGQIRRFPVRKWFWCAGAIGFGLAVLLMIPVGILFSGLIAGVLIVLLLALGSLSRGVSSISFKDVVAKTIPQSSRGTLLATRATTGGILALAAGLLIKIQFSNSQNIAPYLGIIGLAGLLWVSSSVLTAFQVEVEGETAESRNPIDEANAGLELLKGSSDFRNYVLARSILLSIELSLPYYTLFARRLTNGSVGDLGIFVIAASLSQVISSPFWGRLADRASRVAMVAASLTAALAGGLFLGIGNLFTQQVNPYLAAVPLLLLGFAISGVRIGRKTYLVDVAPSVNRPLFVAISNTITGLLTLLGIGLGFIVDAFGVQILLLILVGLAILGIAISWRLPSVEDFRS
jgi:hypothetical protein